MTGHSRQRAVAALASMATLCVIALVVCFAFFTSRGMASSGPVIDTGAPVTTVQCSPCHHRIAESETMWLTFKHGAHLLVACNACHPRMPHGPEDTERPTMASCLTCHGQQHSPVGELADAQCAYCHPDALVPWPSDHVEDWVGEPHADAVGALGTNRCVMCHDAKAECDDCHLQESVLFGPVYPHYIPVLPAPGPRPRLELDLGAPVTAGQCTYCHASIGDFSSERLIFVHEAHVSRDVRCESCHPVFPHTQIETRSNTMADCYRCHSLEHASRGLVAAEECETCHPVEFELKPIAHTPAFEARDHPQQVEQDESYCTLCHEGPFCIECHRARKTMADGSPPRYVIPEDHTEAVWLSKHGPLFMDRTGTCWACHDSPSCERCHYTPMPHPVDWMTTHASYEAADDRPSDCAVCHTNRQSCQECHHETVRRLDLVEENCVPCHEEMAQKPPTDIKRRSFAEHAVHFRVEEVKGRPYRCYECHATWGTGNGSGTFQAHTGTPSDIGHDLRLCYDCHGALDHLNVTIAPWPGAQLCARCHPQGPVGRQP